MTNAPQSPVDMDWDAVPPPGDPVRRRLGFWFVLRIVVMVFGLLSLAFWGYISWAYPTPALFFMVGAPLFAAVIWFFFRYPGSPLGTDTVGKVIVEVALVIAAAGSWLSIGHPVVGLVFLVLAAVSGIVTFRRETAADA